MDFMILPNVSDQPETRNARLKRRLVVQQENQIGPMDDREAVKMKSYFIVLVELERCMPLTTHIPSDQPILFYDLLLAGRRVEPGLGHKQYLVLKRGEITPLPLVDKEASFTLRCYCVFSVRASSQFGFHPFLEIK